LKSVLPGFLDSGNLTGLRIGAPSVRSSYHHNLHLHIRPTQDYFPEELHSSVINPLRTFLTGWGQKELQYYQYLPQCLHAIASADASSNLARYDGVQYGQFVNEAPTFYTLNAPSPLGLNVETPPGSDKKTNLVGLVPRLNGGYSWAPMH